MPDKEPDLDEEEERKLAGKLFNRVWSLLDEEERTQDQDDEMLHAAHASRHHWGRVGGPEHRARGEWQISRVYAVLERAEPAIYHARRCLDTCQANGIGDWDLAFAYEALARAHAVSGDAERTKEYLAQAEAAGREIKDKEDRDLLVDDLKTIPVPS